MTHKRILTLDMAELISAPVGWMKSPSGGDLDRFG